MLRTPATTIAVAIAAVLAGCSSLPDRIDTLEQARSQVRSLEQDPLARGAAASNLESARQAIDVADRAYENDEPIEVVEHEAYVARQHALIAEQRIAEAHAREDLESSEAERTEVLLQAREAEAERAEQLAEQRGAQAALQSARALSAQEQAAQARQRAESAEQRAQGLEQELTDLQAEETERGLVLTLGDVLFDTDQAQLKAGASRTMDRLAEFMQGYPERRVLIEGHTDTRGSDSYNVDLSRRRAAAVADALVERGIPSERIETIGLGEAYPVASNESSAGMQENRRVEIVLSGPQGQFPSGTRRTTSAGGA